MRALVSDITKENVEYIKILEKRLFRTSIHRGNFYSANKDIRTLRVCKTKCRLVKKKVTNWETFDTKFTHEEFSKFKVELGFNKKLNYSELLSFCFGIKDKLLLLHLKWNNTLNKPHLLPGFDFSNPGFFRCGYIEDRAEYLSLPHHLD